MTRTVEVTRLDEGSEVIVHYRVAPDDERTMTATIEQHRDERKTIVDGEHGRYVVDFQEPERTGGLRGTTTGGTLGTPLFVETVDSETEAAR